MAAKAAAPFPAFSRDDPDGRLRGWRDQNFQLNSRLAKPAALSDFSL
jgi:hypothetical protein